MKVVTRNAISHRLLEDQKVKKTFFGPAFDVGRICASSIFFTISSFSNLLSANERFSLMLKLRDFLCSNGMALLSIHCEINFQIENSQNDENKNGSDAVLLKKVRGTFRSVEESEKRSRKDSIALGISA